MIPVLGIPVLGKFEMLKRMLDTIDYPVGLLYIVDNGGGLREESIDWPVENVHIVDSGYNVGVAASWNLIIKANMYEKWWLICNNDIALEAGTLGRLAAKMAEASAPTVTSIAMGNPEKGLNFGAFAVNDAAIDSVGWFDENYHPIYVEDIDWQRRANLLGIEIHTIPSNTFHEGNASWKDDPSLVEQNQKSWDLNHEYYYAKWDHEAKDWNPPRLSRLRSTSWKMPRPYIAI
jgi:GT2 family glycosyltransferase